MALKRPLQRPHKIATAVRIGIAVVVAWAGVTLSAAQALAQGGNSRTLAAELRIMQGDLVRLDDPSLPPLHRDGLVQRLQGALGTVPWMLRMEDDATGADALRPWQGHTLDGRDDLGRLTTLLRELSLRHPLNVRQFEILPDTPVTRREAGIVHRTYCAGCHDGTGNGDADVILPGRDLFFMAEAEAPGVFLARLINGIKGDASLRFANPLTDQQIAALWHHYRYGK